jgi:hypothetical protein
MFGYFWVYRTPTVAMVGLSYYFHFCFGSFLFFLLAVGRRFQVRVRNSFESRLGVRPEAYRSRRWFLPWMLLIGAATYYMVSSQLPMHVAFVLSRAAMDDLADEALADAANANLLAGRWVGLYRINGVEVIGKTVVLYVGSDKGSYGFARVPGAAKDTIHSGTDPEDPHFHRDFPRRNASNEATGKRLADDWFLMYSWYWLVKVGWS